VSEIRAPLGRYVVHADTRCLTFMLDFLNTLDNLQTGTAMHQGTRERGVVALTFLHSPTLYDATCP